jgi:hypothetical protein
MRKKLYFQGKDIDDMDRDELIEAIYNLRDLIQYHEENARQASERVLKRMQRVA